MQSNPAISNALAEWIMQHAEAGQNRIYFRINAEIPVLQGNSEIFFEIPDRGRRVLVLHPIHLTPVALLCCERGIVMIQVL